MREEEEARDQQEDPQEDHEAEAVRRQMQADAEAPAHEGFGSGLAWAQRRGEAGGRWGGCREASGCPWGVQVRAGVQQVRMQRGVGAKQVPLWDAHTECY